MTTTKAYDILRHNFIIANYNSLGAVDNDDGSAFYRSESNFFVYGGGGLKNDWEGHDNEWWNNVIAFPGGPLLHNGYGGQVSTPGKGVKVSRDGRARARTRKTAAQAHPKRPPLICPTPPPCCPRAPAQPGHGDIFVGNIGVVGYDNSYAKPLCAGTDGATVMNTSRVFSPTGKLTTDCGATFDAGAVYAAYTPTMATDTIGFARAVLFH